MQETGLFDGSSQNICMYVTANKSTKSSFFFFFFEMTPMKATLNSADESTRCK